MNAFVVLPLSAQIIANHVSLGEVSRSMLNAWIEEAGKLPDANRKLRLFAADCAARFSEKLTDPRSVAAIVDAREFAHGRITPEQLASSASAASSAASAASAASASSAASYASSASAASYASSAASYASSASAASYASSAASYASYASASSASSASSAASYASSASASASERRWQALRLAIWFSDREPTEWPITDLTVKP